MCDCSSSAEANEVHGTDCLQQTLIWDSLKHTKSTPSWSQEVIFKESKGLLGLGTCQSANFAAQIASTSLVVLQYNILSTVKRFMDYETIGELFRQATQNSHELTVSERIWQAILEFVSAITKVFSIDDEEVLDALINESDELAHICKIYQCKMAS